MSRRWPGPRSMSPAHFSRKFRAAYGETPYSYLMTRRIERAKALLRQGMSVTDTCFAVGCTSLGSFSSRFTEIVGETPSQYRAHDHRALEVVPSCVSQVATATSARPRPRSEPTEQDRRSRPQRGARTVVACQSPSPPCSSPSTILTRRSASTAMRSASRSATTWPPTASAGSPSGPRARTSPSSCPSRTAAAPQVEGDALLSLVTKGSLQAAIFAADDLDATFEKVRASGAEVLQEPTSQPWGARDCAFRDPSGNLVRIAQA